MKERFLNWLMKDCPWYHFWNPNSGLIGGLIFGFIIASYIVAKYGLK